MASWSSAVGRRACACCAPMSSVTSINSHRNHADPELDLGISASQYGVSDLIATMDDHTRKLLSRGRLERRAWLVPRSLLVADLLGLSLAYVLTTLMWGEAGAFGSFHEILVFLATLPCWAIVAKLQGLYRSDQEQADHSTADDVVGVFHLVTIGVWVLLVASRVGGRPNPEHLRADHVLGARHLHPAARADDRPPRMQAGPGLRAEHPDRRRRRGRPADRPQARQASRVRSQRRRLHRPRSEGPASGPSRAPGDSRRSRAVGGHRQVPRRRASRDRLLERAGVGVARRCCASFAPSRSRSTSCRGCSSSSVRA